MSEECNCRIKIKCPVEKKEIFIRHSIFSHCISEEIFKNQKKNGDNSDSQHFAEVLWTTVYMEKNSLNKKNKLIKHLYSIFDNKSYKIYNNWVLWYIYNSDKFYNLTVRSYPQLGRVLFTKGTPI